MQRLKLKQSGGVVHGDDAGWSAQFGVQYPAVGGDVQFDDGERAKSAELGFVRFELVPAEFDQLRQTGLEHCVVVRGTADRPPRIVIL